MRNILPTPARSPLRHALRFGVSLWAAASIAGCLPGTRPVIKVALVAPFEGAHRQIAYEAIAAARMAVRELNTTGINGGCAVELLALDDGGDPLEAVKQAEKVLLDPQVVAVIGHLLPVTTAAAAPIYARAGLQLLSTEQPNTTPPDAGFAQRFAEANGGTAPGKFAMRAYAAMLAAARCTHPIRSAYSTTP